MDAVLLYQKDLEKEILDLTDEVVSVVYMFFEWARKQILLVYYTLDLNLLDPFKVVKVKVMMDEEATNFPKPEPFPSQKEGVI